MSTKKAKTAKTPKTDEELSAANLPKIQLALTNTILSRVQDGTADAALLNVARQLLKDNNIVASHTGKDRKKLTNLAKEVPFPTE